MAQKPTFKERVDAQRVHLCWKGFPAKEFAICANRFTKRFKTKKVEITLEWRELDKPNGYSDEEMLRFMDVFANRQITGEEIRFIQALRDPKVKPVTRREIMAAIQRGTDSYWEAVDKAKPKPIDGTAIEFMTKAVMDLLNLAERKRS